MSWIFHTFDFLFYFALFEVVFAQIEYIKSDNL